MEQDRIEFLICQLVDGDIDPADRAELEQILANDAAAQALLAEQQKLTGLLRSPALPNLAWDKVQAVFSEAIEDEKLDALLRSQAVPAVDYERLQTHLSGRVAEADGVGVVLRMPWVGVMSRVAVAACLLIAAGLGFYNYRPSGGPTMVSRPPVTPVTPMAVVYIPAAESPAGDGVVEVKIGPSAAAVAARGGPASSYAGLHGSRGGGRVIAFPAGPVQDKTPVLGFE